MIYNVFKLLKFLIKKFFYDWRIFWFFVAYYNFRWYYTIVDFLPKKIWASIAKKKFDLNINFLLEKYKIFINEYNYKNIKKIWNSKKIWVLWWQWIDKAPDIVKICINSIKAHSYWYEIILLNKYNLKNYIKLPEFIFKKVENWKITLTHLSDIIRMALLNEYWWIWVDSTMFFNDDVFKNFDWKKLNSNYFYTEKWKNYKWTGFFIWWESNFVFNFCYDFFIKYHQDFDYLIDYFLIDYVIYIAYISFDECKNLIDWIDIHNKWIYDLSKCFNKKFECNEYKKLMETPFFKLSWKEKYKKNVKWDLTNYGKFLNDYRKYL